MKYYGFFFGVFVTVCAIAAWSVTNDHPTGCTKLPDASEAMASLSFSTPWLVKAEREELHYAVGSRWATTIRKTTLDKAKSLIDLLPSDAYDPELQYGSVRVSTLTDRVETETMMISASEWLTEDQLQLIQSLRHSDDFRVTALTSAKKTKACRAASDSIVYYISVVPHQEAEYAGGFSAIIAYLKEVSREDVAPIRNAQVQPGKYFFTVTREGRVEATRVASTCGNQILDEKLCRYLREMPGNWSPARNAQGETVDQDYVFSFGSPGC